jgi:hypothetical protein
VSKNKKNEDGRQRQIHQILKLCLTTLRKQVGEHEVREEKPLQPKGWEKRKVEEVTNKRSCVTPQKTLNIFHLLFKDIFLSIS